MAIFGVLLLHLIGLIKMKFTAWPEMLLWPYLMTQGWLPYKDIAIAHTPLLIFLTTIFYKIFGVGVMQLKIFTWGLIVAIDILLYLVVLKTFKAKSKASAVKTAVATVLTFAFWQIFYDGNGLWFEILVTLFGIALYYFVAQKKYFFAGIVWALMFATKQTAFWFLIPVAFSIYEYKKDFDFSVKSFFGGVLVPVSVFIFSLLALGIFTDFMRWAISFGIFTLPASQGQIQLPDMRTLVIALMPFSIFVPFMLVKPKQAVSLAIWAFFGGLGAYPRFEFFHFQPAIPFLAIATIYTFTIEIKKIKYLKFFLIGYCCVSLLLMAGFFVRNVGEGVRFYEKDVAGISGFVREKTESGDSVFIVNYWDSIYAFTDTLPGTRPWVPQLPWYLNIPGVQERMIESLSDNPPKIIILKPYTDTGLASFKPVKLYNFIMSRYEVGDKIDGLDVLYPVKR